MGSKPLSDIEVDAVVLGLSIAGIAAARSIARSGLRVAVVGLLGDVPLSSFLQIEKEDAVDRENREVQSLQRDGISVTDDVSIKNAREIASGWLLDLWAVSGRVLLRTREIVLAPNGSIPNVELGARFWGRGATLSLRDDRDYLAGKPVVVIGDGTWAIEQARVAIAFRASTVTLVLTNVVSPARREELQANSRLHIFERARSTTLVGDSTLQFVRLADGTKIECCLAAIAFDPRPNRALEALGSAGDRARYSCGVLNGVAFDDFSRLSEDGRCVGTLVAQRLTSH